MNAAHTPVDETLAEMNDPFGSRSRSDRETQSSGKSLSTVNERPTVNERRPMSPESRPNGTARKPFENDPKDPDNPNEAIERSRATLRPHPL